MSDTKTTDSPVLEPPARAASRAPAPPKSQAPERAQTPRGGAPAAMLVDGRGKVSRAAKLRSPID